MGKWSRTHLDNRRKQGLILLTCFVLAVSAGGWAWNEAQRQASAPPRQVASQDVGRLKRKIYDGNLYVEKTALTSLLLIGTDRTENSIGYGARQGGQADFLLLLVFDHNERKIHQLQIDRDTITEVETLGILGNPLGSKVMQICLAHSFGVTSEQNCSFVLQAVENLLEGIQINGYLALGLDSIGDINRMLGGVTVILQEDLSYADPQMIRGAALQLSDEQAEMLVRNRLQLGDGSNRSRMQRQRLYLDAAAYTMRERVRQDGAFFNKMLDTLEAKLVSDLQRNELVNEWNRAYHYEVLPCETLAGEYVIGSDGFVEFHVKPGAAMEWVMSTFYRLDNK